MRTEIIRCATLSSLCRCVELFKLSAFCRATVGRFVDTRVSRIANYLFINNSMFSVHSSMRWFSGKMLFSEQRFKARIANCFGCGYNMIWQVSEDAYSVSCFVIKEEKVKSIGSKLFWKSVKKLLFLEIYINVYELQDIFVGVCGQPHFPEHSSRLYPLVDMKKER